MKAIVFEEINNFHKWIIRYYLLKKYKIYFLRLNALWRTHRWINEFLQKGVIEKLHINYRMPSIHEDHFYDRAFDNLEIFYKKCNRNLINSMTEIYNTDEANLAFKNKLNRELARFYYLNDVMYKIEKRLPGSSIYYVPSNGINWARTSNEETFLYKFYLELARRQEAQFLNSSISIMWWAKLISCAVYFLRRTLIYIKSILFVPWSLFIFLCYRTKRQEGKRFEYGVMIISIIRQFANEDRKVDFLLDGQGINKQNTIFICNQKLNKENRTYLKENKLNFVNRFFDCIKWSDIKRAISRGWLPFFKYHKSHPNIILDTYINLLFCFIKWTSFTNKYDINNLITFSDYGVEAIARNALLKKNSNTSIWFYLDSLNYMSFANASKKMDIYRNGAIGFLNYDYLISWSSLASNYFKAHFNKMKKDYVIGCIWGEHIMEFQKCLRHSDKIQKVASEARRKGYKIIAAFDLGYNYLYEDDGLCFAEGIMKLLEENSDYFVIFKKKKPDAIIKKYNKEIFDKYEISKTHPRVYFTSFKTSPSEVNAFSDLIISFPYTSTTIEALSIRKKALYFDPSGNFKESYYDMFPGLICHSYEELNRRVRNLLLLDEVSYGDYLNKYIKPHIEPHFDGKAITRFRELLTKKDLR